MVTEVTYVIVNDVKQLLTNPSNTCVDDRGVLQERMRNRSCVGWELILDFLVNWISLFFMYLHSILGLVGDMSYLSFVNFVFAVDDNFEC